MKKSKLFRTLTLAVAAALCMATTTVTAYAGGADPDPAPLPETTEAPAEVPEETEEPTTGGMEPEGVPVTPVSYTHLDVYKRQLQDYDDPVRRNKYINPLTPIINV